MITRKQIEKTTAEWESQNPTLAADVIGIEVTISGYNRFKRGDGLTEWSALPYLDKIPPQSGSGGGGGSIDPSVIDARIANHNKSENAHNDIRVLLSSIQVLLSELSERLNAVADSEDIDLDQLSELVAYIKSNRSIIEQVTVTKIGYTDIINNLTTDLANKVLSAAQGVALKALIDDITIPTNISAFNNDVGYLTEIDKQEIIAAVLAALPVYDGEVGEV